MTRLAAAAEEWGVEEGSRQFGRLADALNVSDAWDREHGFFRILLDDATVERAAKTLFELSDTEHFNEYPWEDILPEVRDHWRDRARAVLAAVVDAKP